MDTIIANKLIGILVITSWYSFIDWYGAYETAVNTNDRYKEYLNLDYTFNHPQIHDNVNECRKYFFFKF